MIASSFLYIIKTVVLLGSLFFINLVNVFISTEAYATYNPIDKEIYTSPDWKNLLHYDKEKSVINKDSDFFLSSKGYYNPEAEFIATLEEFSKTSNLDNNHAICRYPARFEYILQSLNLSRSNFPTPKCSEYQKYIEKVVFENVYIAFAAENNIVPSSMMGHTFLRIDGNTRSHAFSYFATFSNTNSLKFYSDIIIGGIDGAYILSSYKDKSAEYLYQENRSIWEFKLSLSDKEKDKLKKHLWELKEKNIDYSLISHNCSTALINILKVANKDFSIDSIKLFITPVEYIQRLHNDNKISDISIEPTETQRNIIEKFGLNYIGNAPKPTRLSISQDLSNNITNMNISPVYQDIRDISDAYFPDLESKMFDLSFNYDNTDKKLTIDKIDILKMKSIIDYSSTNSFSKYFHLGFENDLFNEKTELKPIVEFSLGISKKISTTSIYILPKIGYHHDKFSNFYISPQIGAISKINDNIKIITSYEKYFNTKQNNIGFDEKYNFYIGYKVSSNNEVYFDYSHYSDAKYSDSFTIGLSLHF